MGRNQFDITDEDMRSSRADFDRRLSLSPEDRKKEDEARAKIGEPFRIQMEAAKKERGRKKKEEREAAARKKAQEDEEARECFTRMRAILAKDGVVHSVPADDWPAIDPHFSMSHSEYLRSPLWRRIRRRVMKRDSSQCQLCLRRADVVHHISYEYQVIVGKRDDDLVSLCNACHEALEFDSDGRHRSVEEKLAVFSERKTQAQREMPAQQQVAVGRPRLRRGRP
ncbi:MAG TPA: hypothetical protein VLI06_19605 [Solimonas sp.]|nr:hypothetical protein [Solimonas sp.]